MNYGVAVPFSTDGPSMLESQQSESMEDYLFNNGAVYETPAGERARLAAIEKLRALACEWATQLGRSKSVPAENCIGGGGIQLRVFGSTRLGVHNADSDIDILFLAPSFVTRQDFFNQFRAVLAESEGVDSILAVPEAFTPVLKFTIDSQAIDMVFAAPSLPFLPVSLDILDPRVLRGMDEASVRSINGPRVAEWILRLVPNIDHFCAALRVIKYWARQRGLYSNMLGFLGGINYAILVAQICQLFVRACPFTLVQKFFEVFAMWDWRNPVMLRSYEDLGVEDIEGRPLQVWNALASPKDAAHLMPIITPAYPAMNSAYNVSQPQFRAIQYEFARGCKIFQEHAMNPRFPWAKLFEPFNSKGDFFDRYPHYVQVDVTATDSDDQRSWFGWIESRLRFLVVNLDQPPLMRSHPVANWFHRCTPAPAAASASAPAPSSSVTTATATATADGAAADDKKSSSSSSEDPPKHVEKKNAAETEEHTPEIAPETPDKNITEKQSGTETVEVKKIYSSTIFIGLSFEKKGEPGLKPAIQEFEYKVRSWPGFKPSMELKIQPCDRKSLPSYVREGPAMPSDVKTCTPQPPRPPQPLDRDGGDIAAVSSQLFPPSARKSGTPISREASETGLSQVLGRSSLADPRDHPAPRGMSSRSYPNGLVHRGAPSPSTSRSPRSPRIGVRTPIPLPPAPFMSSPRSGPGGARSFGVSPTVGAGGGAVFADAPVWEDGAGVPYLEASVSPASTEYYSPNGHIPAYASAPAVGPGQPVHPEALSNGYGRDYNLHPPALQPPLQPPQPYAARPMPFPAIPAADGEYVPIGPPHHLVAPQFPGYAQPPPPPFQPHSPPKRHRRDAAPNSQGSAGSGSSCGSGGDGRGTSAPRRKKNGSS